MEIMWRLRVRRKAMIDNKWKIKYCYFLTIIGTLKTDLICIMYIFYTYNYSHMNIV